MNDKAQGSSTQTLGFKFWSLGSSSISSGAQFVTLRKYFSHPSLVMYSFATPPIKLKLEQKIGWGPVITNHLDQSL